MQRYIGIEIGGTKLQIAIGDATGEILNRRKMTVARTDGAAGIQRQIEQALGELADQNKAQAVGVGFGGPVDWRTGKIYRSHHIEGWSDFDLGGWLQELAGAPVV